MANGAPDLQIVGAAYGLGDVTSEVIPLVNRQTSPQSLSVQAGSAVFGDTWPKVKKTLTVAYRYGETGVVCVATAIEGETLTIGAAQYEAALAAEPVVLDGGPQLFVLAATYGPADETAKVQGMITPDQTLSFTANNKTFGDPWPGYRKAMVVVAAFTGQVPFVDVVQENESYSVRYRPPFRLLSARWATSDVFATVQEYVSQRTLSVPATTAVLGDPMPEAKKSLSVVTQYGDEQPLLSVVEEQSTLSVDYQPRPAYQPPPDSSTLNVIAASYGPADVTAKVQALEIGNSLDFTANNATFGDPWKGVQKTFALTYSWGPQVALSTAVKENGPISVSQPLPPVAPPQAISLDGLFASGDSMVLQAGDGGYWIADPAHGGQIYATASGPPAATRFVVESSPGEGIHLNMTNGAPVGVGSDGRLTTAPPVAGALFVPSVTSTGALVLNVAGSDFEFARVESDHTIKASGRDALSFDALFGVLMQPTQAGLDAHLRAYRVDASQDPSLLACKVVWDLSVGFFMALGAGQWLRGEDAIPGLYGLVMRNTAVAAVVNGLVTTVRNHPYAVLGLVPMLEVVEAMWTEGLLWPVTRFVLEDRAWILVTYLLAQVLSYCVPGYGGAQVAYEAVERVLAFVQWAYTTTMDVLAWINSGAKDLPAPSTA